MSEIPTSSWRVKVYKLCQEQWLDRGTGFCNGEINDNNEAILIVHNEENREEVLLDSRVCGDTQYQKQQGTLVVWTDQEQSEMALSFQEPEGCSVICDFLVYVQKNFEHGITVLSVNTDVSTSEGYEVTELIAGPINLPPEPSIGGMRAVLESLSVAILSAEGREQTVMFIRDNNYIQKLVDILAMAEDLESIDDLYNLCRIVKLLFLMNDGPLYDLLLCDDYILGVVGMLEYDPDFPGYKANHREYLSDEKKFNEVVPISDLKIRSKIRQTFRLQFLKDVALARLLDESTCSMIASIIYFNQIEIIGFIQNNKEFSLQLFALYDASVLPASDAANDTISDSVIESPKSTANGDSNSSIHSEPNSSPVHKRKLSNQENHVSKKARTEKNEKSADELLHQRRDGVKFIHQLSSIAKGFQQNQRYLLYNNLIQRGLLKLIRFALNDSGAQSSRLLGTELLVTLLEHDPSLVRNAEDDLGLRVLIDLFLNEEDIVLKTHASDTLKVQLDANFSNNLALLDKGLENSGDDDSYDELEGNDSSEVSSEHVEDRREDSDEVAVGSLSLVRKSPQTLSSSLNGKRSTLFEDRIYMSWLPILFAPLIELNDEKKASFCEAVEQGKTKLTFSSRATYEQLCDILAFCLEQHPTRCRNFIVEHNLWNSIAKVIIWPNKHVQLAAIRCLRAGMEPIFGDDMTAVLESRVLQAFWKVMLEVIDRNNLVLSACLELLEAVDNTALKFHDDLQRYENSWAGMLFFEWFNEAIDDANKLAGFPIVKRLIARYRRMLEEVNLRMQENQASELDNNFILTSDDENHNVQENNALKDPAIVAAAAAAAAAASVTFRNEDIKEQDGIVRRRSSLGGEELLDGLLPMKQKRKSRDDDTIQTSPGKDKKGLRRTLATAGKKLTLSFRGGKKK